MIDLNQIQKKLKVTKLNSGPNNNCWENDYSKDRNGFITMYAEGKQRKAHRYSFELANPNINITGKLIKHTCGNFSCIKPSHLFCKTIEIESNIPIEKLRIIDKKAGINGDCWKSSFSEGSGGFVQIPVNGVQMKAHRYSFMIHNPDIDINGKIINHSCNNNWCVNPEHLFCESKEKQFENPLDRLKIISTTEGPNKDCWETDLNKDRDGYTRVWIDSKMIGGHRYSFMLHNPDIDITNKLICHSCDNPSCVNPKHLFFGTHADNTQDKVNKNRQTKNSNNLVVLNDIIIKDILNRIIDGTFKLISEISEFYDVERGTISRMINGKSWTHVTNNFDMIRIRNLLISNRNIKVLTQADVFDINIRLLANETCSSIARLYNVSDTTINRIKNGKTHLDG